MPGAHESGGKHVRQIPLRPLLEVDEAHVMLFGGIYKIIQHVQSSHVKGSSSLAAVYSLCRWGVGFVWIC